MNTHSTTPADLARDLQAQITLLHGAAHTRQVPSYMAVLYADCGMVVGLNADGSASLKSTRNGLADAKVWSMSAARIHADRWNANLTAAQAAARCTVTPLPFSDAVARAIKEMEAVLDTIANLPVAAA